MNLLSDCITYVRRIIKSPSNAVISDDLIIDYINRFWMMDVDARIQTFDLKTTYAFQTTPGVDKYNMPLYSIQNPGDSAIGFYPVYQGFLGPAYVNGIQVQFQTQRTQFYNMYPKVPQSLNAVAVGDGGASYSFTIPSLSNSTPVNPPVNAILRGHIDITGIIKTNDNVDPPLVDSINANTYITSIATTSIEPAVYITSTGADNSNIVITDSGLFLEDDQNYGLLINPGKAPYGNTSLGSYSILSNTINYVTGEVNVVFPQVIPVGVNINVQVFLFQSGLPRSMLFYNNTLTLRSPPAQQYLVELEAYLSPAAFLNSALSLPFGYMTEYIARGAARKILSDTGDVEQFMFYEPLFKEQEMLVWKRSQRQWTATRTETIYSQGNNIGRGNTLGGAIT